MELLVGSCTRSLLEPGWQGERRTDQEEEGSHGSDGLWPAALGQRPAEDHCAAIMAESGEPATYGIEHKGQMIQRETNILTN